MQVMASSILRLMCRRKGAAGILRSGGSKMMSTTTSTTNVASKKISPWLMLPPTFDRSRGGMVYNFYSLADDEVLRFDKYSGGPDPIELPDDDAMVVGSSHGWLALMNRRNNDLYLSNPLSRRHIKLPPVDALPDPVFNLRRGGRRAFVSKVILSAPPDEDTCRAMMSFGPGDRLAFCLPGRSSAWTPVGELWVGREDCSKTRYARVYEDFLYSKRRNVFNCLTNFAVDDYSLEDWDLRIPASPRIDWIQTNKSRGVPEELQVTNSPELSRCSIMKHLVYAEERDELFLVFRWIRYATACFAVAKVEKSGVEGKGEMRVVPASLEGLAAFVGTNQSLAVEAAEYPHLKGNCIYFTDNKVEYTPREYDESEEIKGGDIGIYDCAQNKVSSCYYPCLHPYTKPSSSSHIVPPPIWFTPTSHFA